jgi:hypothetical protein
LLDVANGVHFCEDERGCGGCFVDGWWLRRRRHRLDGGVRYFHGRRGGFGGSGIVGSEFGGIVDFAGAAGRRDVGVGVGDGDPGLFIDVADDQFGTAHDAQLADVRGCELEAVEQRVSLLTVDISAGERVDHAGDGELGGFAVLYCRQLNARLVGHAGVWEVDLVAVDVVAAVQTAVEVAEFRAGEGNAMTLEAVGLNVATEIDCHGSAPLSGIPPRGGVAGSGCGRMTYD